MDESAPQCLAEIVNTPNFSSSTPMPSLPAYIFRDVDLTAPKNAPDYPLLPEEYNLYTLDDAEKESLLFLDTPFVALLLPFAIVPARIARTKPEYIIGLLRKSLFAFVSPKLISILHSLLLKRLSLFYLIVSAIPIKCPTLQQVSIILGSRDRADVPFLGSYQHILSRSLGYLME